MKTLMFTVAMLLSIGMNAQNAIKTIFKQYAEDDKFTSVYISEHMFGLLADLEVDDEEDKAVLDVLSGLKELHVLTTEEGDGIKLFEEATKKINTTSYIKLMEVHDKEDNVRFFIKKEGKLIEELLLMVGSTDEFVLLSLVGTIDLKKISKISGHLNIPNLDKLQNLEKEGEGEGQ